MSAFKMPNRMLSSLRGPASQVTSAKQAWSGRLILSEEVEHAMHKGGGIVALESTIITHGMKSPTNLTCAQSVEQIIRENGATPATIALIDGKVHVGLDDAQLRMVADPQHFRSAVKTSRRDIAPVLARRVLGGTTVAGTMYIASTVGIPIFVTGGIGGVHRGGEASLDISADLTELGRTPVTVVCAGAKSILDIPRTLEYLETQGVCVTTYGPRAEFPAFYTPSTGIKTQWAVDNPHDAARIIGVSQDLPVPLSTLLAVPIPEQYQEAGETVQNAVEQAIGEMFSQGIDRSGKDVSPWLLKRVGELTGDVALDLNVKLIENNARVGSQVARALAELRASNL